METIAGQFTSQLVGVFNKTRSKTPALTNPTQLLVPANSWDWSVSSEGTISADQFNFSDKMPASSQSGTMYTASSSNFSQNYRTFLEVLPANFPQSLLNTAKANIAVPAGNPANDPTPTGWTKVLIAGIIQWEPVYTLSDSAYQWKIDVESGAINNPGTIVINLKEDPNSPASNSAILSDKPDPNDPSSSLDSSGFEEVSITADSWGQISIYPGSWFNSSIITIAPNFGVSKDLISSLLSVRASSFYVAYKPVFKFSSSTPVATNVLTEISNASELYALGVEVSSPEPSNNNKSVSFTATSPDPSIVAVAIETFPH